MLVLAMHAGVLAIVPAAIATLSTGGIDGDGDAVVLSIFVLHKRNLGDDEELGKVDAAFTGKERKVRRRNRSGDANFLATAANLRKILTRA